MSETESFEIGRAGACVTVTVHSEITELVVQRIRRRIQEEAESGATSFIVDISELNMVASIAVGLFVGIRAKTVETGGRIAVINASPTIQKMFEMIRLDSIIPIVDSMEAARKIIASEK